MLHACCGPCSLEPVRLLREEGFEPIILWCNPNIQPAAEHDLRLVTLLAWAEKAGVAVVEGACDREAWERVVAPHGMDRVARCRACYALRLAETCRQAEERGFRYVSTTLAVSPYQLFDVCSEELEAIARAHGLEPVVRDFRPQYPQATRESRELGMYRQNYCGCRFSAAEATIERQERRDERAAQKVAARASR
jgi:predicted adenine nucleotide alpha hydrolase (AANH) superfamily ATPase